LRFCIFVFVLELSIFIGFCRGDSLEGGYALPAFSFSWGEMDEDASEVGATEGVSLMEIFSLALILPTSDFLICSSKA